MANVLNLQSDVVEAPQETKKFSFTSISCTCWWWWW